MGGALVTNCTAKEEHGNGNAVLAIHFTVKAIFSFKSGHAMLVAKLISQPKTPWL